MKAFLIAFIVLFLTVNATAPIWAKVSDYQTSTSQTITVPTVSPTPTSVPKLTLNKEADQAATAAGTVRLLPAGDGTYQIVPFDPQGMTDTEIREALGCGPFSFACDAVKSVGSTVIGNFFDCVKSPFSLDVKGFLYNCSGASTVIDLTKKPSEWALGEIMSVGAALIKAGVMIIQNTLIQQMAGCEPEDTTCWSEQYQTVMNPNEPVKNAGALLILANITGNLASMQMPISTDLYLANMNPFQQVDAQGISDLRKANVIFSIWQKARDAAYALSIVILVVVGFLIMLRTRLDSKTSVNLTYAIPRIVIMLLLITFSFAISGLIIDFGRLAVQFGLYLIPDTLTINTLGRLFLNTVYLVSIPLFLWVTGIATFACGSACGAGATAALLLGGGFFFIAAAAAIAILLFLIMLVLILILMLYLIFIMVTRYAKFIVSTMISPLVMLAFPLPHGTDYIIDFYKRQFAYILTIPIIIFLVEVSFAIAGSCIPSPFSGGVSGRLEGAVGFLASPCGEDPEILGQNFNPMGLFSAIAPLIGLGVLFMSTKAGDIADGLLQIKPISGHGGGRGHGGVFGLFALPAEGLEKVADISKGYQQIRTPLTNIASGAILRSQGIGRAGVPKAQILPQTATVLEKFTGRAAVPTAAEFAGKPDSVKKNFDTGFLAIKDQFAGIAPDVVERMVGRGDYLPLINNLRQQIGMPAIDQSGQVPGNQGPRWARVAGRPFGVNEESIRKQRSTEEEEFIRRAVIGGSTPEKPTRLTSVFTPRTSGDTSPDEGLPPE